MSDNAQANDRRDPTGADGITSCITGFVWRKARTVDHVCVTPAVHDQVVGENAAASSRVR
jgi:hypothetical protein